MSGKILVCDAIKDILVHMEEEMTKPLLKPVTAQHNGVDNSISAMLESLIELIFGKVVRSP